MSRLSLKGHHLMAVLMMAVLGGLVATAAPAQANPSINWTVNITPPVVKAGQAVSTYSIRADQGYTAKIALLRSGQAVATKVASTAGINVPVTGAISKTCTSTTIRATWQTTIEIRSSSGVLIKKYATPIVTLSCY